MLLNRYLPKGLQISFISRSYNSGSKPGQVRDWGAQKICSRKHHQFTREVDPITQLILRFKDAYKIKLIQPTAKWNSFFSVVLKTWKVPLLFREKPHHYFLSFYHFDGKLCPGSEIEGEADIVHNKTSQASLVLPYFPRGSLHDELVRRSLNSDYMEEKFILGIFLKVGKAYIMVNWGTYIQRY